MRRALAPTGIATAVLALGTGCWLTASFDGITAPEPLPQEPDGAAEAAAPDGGCEGTLLCDDFEHGGAFDLTIWPRPEADQVRATIAIDRARARSGEHSLHVRVPPSPDGGRAEGFLIHKRDAPLPSTFHGRVFVFVPTERPAEPWRPELLGFQDKDGKGFGLSFAQGLTLNAFVYSETPRVSVNGTAPVPAERWACVTWVVEGAGTPTSRLEVSVDGAPILEARSQVGFPSFVELYLGLRLETPSPTVASDVWFDDLAVAEAPIPCAS